MAAKQQLKEKSKKNRFIIILAPVLVLFAFVCFFGFVSLQIELNQKNTELAKIEQEIQRLETENQLLSRYLKAEYKVEYIENIARDELGYALPEERIYYIIPAD